LVRGLRKTRIVSSDEDMAKLRLFLPLPLRERVPAGG
jgi:hypothetical protein